INDGPPSRGPDTDERNFNIHCFASARVSLSNVRLTDGVAGIYLHRCVHARLQYVEGHNIRGVRSAHRGFARGEFIQFNESDGGILEDFSVENDPKISEVRDTLNVYNSANIVIRRGILDGNNSPNARNGNSLVIDTGSHDVLVEDVDVIHG